MENFNKTRFLNFAKFDLTINRTFYRNLLMVTVIGALGIAAACFSGRYWMWSFSMHDTMDDYYYMPEPGSWEHYNTIGITAAIMTEFLLVMMLIFAGCWAHNLRRKQERITELTLPATNAEKYLWHTGLMVLGGLALCFGSLLMADGFNALLTLGFCPAGDGVASITAKVLDFCTLDIEGIVTAFSPDENASKLTDDLVFRSVQKLLTFLMIAVLLSSVAVYHFCNAVKYKYNIILTYVALYVLQIVLTVVGFMGGAFMAEYGLEAAVSMSEYEAFQAVRVGLFALACFFLAVAFFLPRWSYHLYTKAQITSKLNK